jgi:hypothetical protein
MHDETTEHSLLVVRPSFEARIVETYPSRIVQFLDWEL